jgi:hypothetical protein
MLSVPLRKLQAKQVARYIIVLKMASGYLTHSLAMPKKRKKDSQLSIFS